ncbi:MAG: nucleoside deaminase [Candidatus Heimdallarchaeota archaeon]|nr:nucleoside deaminase [Candidatus Heimdallarchaeota archaeon]
MDTKQKMQIAIKVAKEALNKGELPISAVIFHGNEIISSCHTSEKEDKRFLIHAELKALLDADRKQYPIKIRKEMQLFTNLEPCMMCLGAAMTFFIGEIYYALEAPMDGAVEFAKQLWKKECKEIPSYQLPKITSGILRVESQELFKEYIRVNKPGPLYDFAKSLALL